ncbi:MAG: GntR family transcriptional regulator [Planctomycetes bacterium]|nr:GntR family transcriptional regulator [Planctomycetota bacterium]
MSGKKSAKTGGRRKPPVDERGRILDDIGRIEDPIGIDLNSPVPKYYQLMKWLEFDYSHSPFGRKLPSERELARRSGVTVATVRQALRELEREGKIRREQGRGTFSKNCLVLPKPPGTDRPRVVLAFFDLGGTIAEGYGYIVSELIAGCEDTLSAGGCDLQVLDVRPGKRKEAGHLLFGGGIAWDGLVLTDPWGKLRQTWEQAAAQHLPHAAIGENAPPGQAAPPGAQWVCLDTEQGGAQVAAAFHERGRRRMAYVGGEGARLRGFRKQAAELGLEISEEYVRIDRAISLEECDRAGHAGALRLLGTSPPPEAIFAGNDFRAFGVLRALQERGVPVPLELDVVGFDDVAGAASLLPALASVRLPLRQAAELAAWATLFWIAHPRERTPRLDCLQPQYCWRESLRAKPVDQPKV